MNFIFLENVKIVVNSHTKTNHTTTLFELRKLAEMIKESEEFAITQTTYDTHERRKKYTHMRPTHSKSPITLKHILLQYENYSITNDIYIQPKK